MINTYTSLHTHSEYSTALLRFADAIIKIPNMLQWAYDNGLRGIALTDHQGISGYVDMEQSVNKMNIERPFQHIFGNEFYLLSKEEDNLRFSEDQRPYYWHYLVNVLDEVGLKQMYELSSRAWLRSYIYKGLLRRPSFYEDFEEVVGTNPGHLIASTACLGGYLPHCILNGKKKEAIDFIKWNQQVFGKDCFFLECQPCFENNEEQIKVNQALWTLHEKFDIPIIVTTDAHYLRPEDRYIHTAFLKSKDGGDSREPEKFYQTTYLFTPQELRETLYISGFNDEQIDVMFQTTNDIAVRVKPIKLKKKTRVPALPTLPEFQVKHKYKKYYDKYPHIAYYANSSDPYEQFYYFQVEQGLTNYLQNHNVNLDKYLNMIDIEMEQVKGLGEVFDGERMSDYFTVVQKVVDLIWSEGDSLVGIGRGCFTGEAPVWTKSGLKKLEEVQIGDEVISADGKFNRVLNTMNYNIKEPMIKIEYRTQGSSRKYMPSICTLDHKILTELDGKIEYVEAQNLTYSHKLCLPKLKLNENFSFDKEIDLANFTVDSNYTEEYIEEKILTNKPYLYSPHDLDKKLKGSRSFYQKLVDGRVTGENKKNKKLLEDFFANTPFNSIQEYSEYCLKNSCKRRKLKRKIKIDEDFCVFAGLMFGDGYISIQKSAVMLAINNSENNRKNIYNRKVFEDFAKNHGFDVVERKSTNNKKLSQLFIYSNILAKALGEWLFVSKIKKEKKVPKWVYELPGNFLKNVKKGLSYSDGFFNEKTNKRGFDSTSCSLISLYKFIDMYENTTVSRLDIRPSYIHSAQSYVCKQSYKLGAPIVDKYKGQHVITQNENYWFLPITKLEKIPEIETTVYDLTIENNPSYTIGNMCVHNSAGCYETNKLLGITGIDPLLPETEEFYPWWRFCSIARSDSIFDIDIDVQSFKKEKIIQAIKNFFGWRRVCQVVTWGKLTSRTSLERAGKGLGISDDVIGYIKSLIPVKRGAIYSLKDCVEGNTKKGRERVPEFVNEVKKYPGLLETALAFEGMIVSSGVHAGALNVLKSDFTETGSLMVSANGAAISQFDLHQAEYVGDLKFDLLSIDALECIRTCIELLIKNGYMEWKGSLRETYNYYLSYDALEKTNKEMWALLPNMVNAFQYDSRAGRDALNKIGATNLTELTLANGLMRLAVPNGEQPMDMYVRYRRNIKDWYEDMTAYGIPQKEQEILKELLGNYCGMMIAQSTMMSVLMDKRICGFTLKEADKARKAVAKRSPEALIETEKTLYEKGFSCGRSKAFLDYLWNVQIEMSKNYAFDFSHSHEYSTECLQELNMYWRYPKVFWNAAVVITQAQTQDERENSANAIDYGKIAQSIYKAKENKIYVNSPSINNSELSFSVNNQNEIILFGLSAIAKINTDIANQIISNRPYTSFKDFYDKNSFQGSLITTTKFITLIKSGCFDDFEPNRVKVMKQFIYYSHPMKESLTMANLDEIIKIGCKIPDQLLSPILFKKYVCSARFFHSQHPKFKSKKLYWLDERALKYFNKKCISSLQENVDYFYQDDLTLIVDKSIEKIFKPVTEELKTFINTPKFIKEYNKQSMRKRYNELVPNQDPNHWSMETCSFYSNEHELSHIDKERYNISLFDELPEEPKFITKKWGKREFKQYELSQIAGVVLDRKDANHLLTILDINNNVVQCKFVSENYSWYKRQISIPDGKGGKTIVDPSWFKRGQGLILTGYRYGESDFKVKVYKNSVYRKKVKKIESIDNETGEIVVKSNRYGYGEDDE